MKKFNMLLVAAVMMISFGHAQDWREFHSVKGSCKIHFPESPQHVQQKVALSSDLLLEYDAYIAKEKSESVYMMLIAYYPLAIDEDKAETSMEGFLNGILNHNQNNKLIFAGMTEVSGHKAMDFFIQSGKHYFKGRAMVVNNRLYLMTVECEAHRYDDEAFDHFIQSFSVE